MGPFRSQGGRLIFLASPEAKVDDEFHVSLVSFGSGITKRFVRATIQAKAYNMQSVVEEADLVCAAVVDCPGLLDRRSWETSASDQMVSVGFTDCQSLKSALGRPIVRTIDKRLGIELASFRRQLWRNKGRSIIDARTQEGPPRSPTDMLRWIDTNVMVSDCLPRPNYEGLLLTDYPRERCLGHRPARERGESRKSRSRHGVG